MPNDAARHTFRPADNSKGDPSISVALVSVDASNWHDVAGVKVAETQRDFVAEPSYYLALCAYGGLWRPLAIVLDGTVIGFLMWAEDPEDGSCWLGGILIDREYQRHGYGRSAVQEAVRVLGEKHGHSRFALSYRPDNTAARSLYLSLGFLETEEWEDDEIVARLTASSGSF